MLRDYKHQGDDFQEFNENEPKEINIVIEHEERVDVPLKYALFTTFFCPFFGNFAGLIGLIKSIQSEIYIATGNIRKARKLAILSWSWIKIGLCLGSFLWLCLMGAIVYLLLYFFYFK